MFDTLDREAGDLEGGCKRSRGEVGAMLVEKVPDHLVAQDPIDTRCLKENARVWRICEGLADALQQLQRIWGMFDHMPAYDNIGGHIGAIWAIVAALEPDSPIEGSIWANIARIKSIAAIALSSANQLLEKDTLATADLYNSLTAHAAL